MTHPRLNQTTAKRLLYQTPAEAYRLHPDLGGESDPATDAMRDGLIYEAAIMEGGVPDSVAIVDAPDFRSKAAREARDAAIDDGQHPVTRAKWEEVYAPNATRLREIMDFDGLGKLESQVSLKWCAENNVLCKGTMDLWFPQVRQIIDLKMTNDLSDAALIRTAGRLGWYIQHAAYMEGADEMGMEPIAMQFVAYTIKPVPDARIVTLTGEAQLLGRNLWDRAKEIWARCLGQDNWPGWGAKPLRLTPTPWQMADIDEEGECDD